MSSTSRSVGVSSPNRAKLVGKTERGPGALSDPFGRRQLQVTVRLESEASIDARASRSAGFTDRPYFCLTATT